MQSQGYNPENFLLFDDNSLLALYCQAVAALGVAAPLYLLLLQEALGGLEATLHYGLRATAMASAFLYVVHFIAGNLRVVMPRLPREKKPLARMHAQHALSLLFTTYQMHFAQGAALAILFPAGFRQQPPGLTGLMVASYVAVWALARCWGAVRCTWTAAGAAKALAARPAAAHGALASGCRYFLALSFFLVYAWRAAVYASQGRIASHAAVFAAVYVGAGVHAVVAWRARRAEALAAGSDVAVKDRDQ
ncbi:MAG: hypothetical protein J3K34DRAFT_443244 [Monoraphidium minutum]|nr:MAG: hypothetical protein J3K34DRAFT_443244 [Monoraphidium minutum]